MLRRTCTRLYNRIWLGRKFGPNPIDARLKKRLATLLTLSLTFLEDIELVLLKGRNEFLAPHLVPRLQYLRFSYGLDNPREYLASLPEMRHLTHLDLVLSGDELQGLHPTIPNLARLDLRLRKFSIPNLDLSEFSRLRRLGVCSEDAQLEQVHLELPSSLTDLTLNLAATVSGSGRVQTLCLKGAQAYDLSPRLWPSLTHLDYEPIQDFLNNEGLQLRTLTVSRLASKFALPHPGRCGPRIKPANLRELVLKQKIANATKPKVVWSTIARYLALETLELAMETAENLATLLFLHKTLVRLTIRTSQLEGRVDLATIGKLTMLEFLEVGSTQFPKVEGHLPHLNSCRKMRHLTLKRLVLVGLGLVEFPNLQSARLFFSEDTESRILCARLPQTLEHLELGFHANDRKHLTGTLLLLRRLWRLKWFDFRAISGAHVYFHDIVKVIPATCGTLPRLSLLRSAKTTAKIQA